MGIERGGAGEGGEGRVVLANFGQREAEIMQRRGVVREQGGGAAAGFDGFREQAEAAADFGEVAVDRPGFVRRQGGRGKGALEMGAGSGEVAEAGGDDAGEGEGGGIAVQRGTETLQQGAGGIERAGLLGGGGLRKDGVEQSLFAHAV
jgi:hypothetical protein